MRLADFIFPNGRKFTIFGYRLKGKVLITGGSGLLGHHLAQFLHDNRFETVTMSKDHAANITGVREIRLDMLDFTLLQDALVTIRPACIVHCAGLTNVDACEANPELAHKMHVQLTQKLAEFSVANSVHFVQISTDHLWNGSNAYTTEETPHSPLNVYGQTKSEGELIVSKLIEKPLIIRTNFYGEGLPWRPSFSDWVIRSLREGKVFDAFHDVYFTPISISHLCRYMVELMKLGANGVFNIASSEKVSKYEFAIAMANRMAISADIIRSTSVDDRKLLAQRPRDMSLSTDKIAALLGHPMPTLADGIATLRI